MPSSEARRLAPSTFRPLLQVQKMKKQQQQKQPDNFELTETLK